MRIPPTADGKAAGEAMRSALLADPPYGAKVRFELEKSSSGWNAPAMSPWLAQALEGASQAAFGAPAMYMGEGGTIPFMGMLGARFPGAQFVITGVLGPHSNAHGPNEFLHIPTGKRVTSAVATVLAQHCEASAKGLTRGP
jgi:acetylornithine deacetylase/succinyl-diaminopimelate desuccinylase-like protein